MILSGSAVQVKGFGWALCSATKRLMAAWRSTTDRKTPRFSRRLVSLAKKPSTALSHEARGRREVEGEARVPVEPLAHLGMLVGGVVVEDHVDDLSGGNLRLNGVEEADELLVPMALHVAADDLAVENVEGGEQRRCAMPFVVVGHRAGAALLHRQPGWVRSSAWIWLFSSTERTMAWAGGST